MKNLVKKLALAIPLSLPALSSFAEGEGAGDNTAIVKVSDVQAIFTQAQTNMTSLIEAAMPVIIAFVVGGLVIWGAIALVGVIKRAWGAGKGR